MNQTLKSVSTVSKKAVEVTVFTKNKNIRKAQSSLTLKAKISLISLVVSSVIVFAAAYHNESMFMDKIAVSFFIITCIGVIRLMSGTVSKESK